MWFQAPARPRLAAADACERLASSSLGDADADVTGAAIVPAGAAPFRLPRAFCRVLVTIEPTSDSEIKAEVWLPLTGWNGRLQAVGNGDAAGVISDKAMAAALAD